MRQGLADETFAIFVVILLFVCHWPVADDFVGVVAPFFRFCTPLVVSLDRIFSSWQQLTDIVYSLPFAVYAVCYDVDRTTPLHALQTHQSLG